MNDLWFDFKPTFVIIHGWQQDSNMDAIIIRDSITFGGIVNSKMFYGWVSWVGDYNITWVADNAQIQKNVSNAIYLYVYF